MPRQSPNSGCGNSRRRKLRWRWRKRWLTCPLWTTRSTAETDILHVIAQGDLEGLDQCLRCLQIPPARVTVRCDHPTKLLGVFFQECSPAVWAVECRQWHLLPLLSHHGYDVNRPQFCRRWTCFCRKQIRPNNSPYRRLWTRGQYTYQSTLDYFFANAYERLGELEDTALHQQSDLTENLLQTLLSSIGELFTHGVDVHRIDSIIVFNSLAGSFDRCMCRYFDADDDILPDIPKRTETFVELDVLWRLIENGFSEFEFMEYVSPNTNWFGILICLLAHPRLAKLVKASRPVPALLRSVALLFINLLVWRRSTIDLQDSVNNLRLRTTYVRRYADKQSVFNAHVAGVIREADGLLRSPLTLCLLARNRIRGLLGGKNFKTKVANLGLPPNLAAFLASVGLEHMAWVRAPPFVAAVAADKLTTASFEELEGTVRERNYSPMASSSTPTTGEHRPSLPSPPSAAAVAEPESPMRRAALKRRASACPRIGRLQPMAGPALRVQRSMTAVVRGPRPSSAPLVKVTPKLAHRRQLPVR